MKRQKYPASVIKTGASLYKVVPWYDDEDDKYSVDLEVWVVRSIRRKAGQVSRFGKAKHGKGTDLNQRVNITRKMEGVTWTKGEWEKSIPDWLRKQFTVGDDLPEGYYTTAQAAFRYAKDELEENIKRGEKELADGKPNGMWASDLEHDRRLLSLVKGRITKEKNKAKK